MTWPDPTSLLKPLAAWFEATRRVMPWRAQDLSVPHPDPWAVLVSELMLQQTQVATVIPYFERWMAAFPTPADLAQAPEAQAMKLWEGLGYYRRARFLQAAAQHLTAHGWPSDLNGLHALPGVGPYTAAALASIAFQQPEAALDGNAFRVLSRLLVLEGDPTRHAGALRTWLRPALADLGPSRLTQAIMELGARVCAPSPECQACPLEGACGARRQGLERQIPPPKVRPAVKEIALHLVALTDGHRWLLHPPKAKGLLAGLWHWPSASDLPAVPDTGILQAAVFPGWTQVYTHRREQVNPWRIEIAPRPAPEGLVWVEAPDLPALPLGRRDQRLRDLLRGGSASAPAWDGPNPGQVLAAILH